MFFGILPRQIATYDLPISFGEIMTLGENDLEPYTHKPMMIV